MAQQRMKNLTVKEVEYITFRLARKHLAFDEPIPDFTSRFPNILESCLLTPFQSLYGKRLYPTLSLRASMLFYLLIKNHPFLNGNKRIAITTLLVFLRLNAKWITVDSKKLYNFTVWVAQSPAELKDHVVCAIEQFIKTNWKSRQDST